MGRVKRVRFADSDTVYPSNCKPDACSLPAKGRITATCKLAAIPTTLSTLVHEAFLCNYQHYMSSTICPRSNCNFVMTNEYAAEDPKTSEFAFYKKLRKDAGHNYHSHPLTKQDNPFNKFLANNRTGDLTKMVKSNCEIRSLLPVEKVTTPIQLMPSHSPSGDSRKSGPLSRNMEVFPRKRQKLLQSAAKASLLDIDHCHSNGYDLVSVLLRRLVPESNSSSTRKLRHSELNTRSRLIASPVSDTPFKELPQIPTMKSISPTTRQDVGNCLFEFHSKKSKETAFSLLDSKDADSPLPCHANKFDLQHQKSDNIVNGRRNTGLSESCFGGHNLDTKFQLNGYGNLSLDHVPTRPGLNFSTHENTASYWVSPKKSLGLRNKSNFKEFGGLQYPNESLCGREQYTRLLDWDDNNLENEQDWSISSHRDSTVLNLNLPWRTSFEESLNCKFDTSGLHSSSIFPIRQYPDYTLWDFCSDTYPIHAVGRQVLEDRDYQVLVSNHFPVNFSCSPNHLSLQENIRLSHNDHWRRFFCSPYSSCRVRSEVFREKLPPSMDTLQITSGSGHNFDFGWKSLSLTNSLEANYSSNLSDLQFHMKDLKRPLLIEDKSTRCLDISSLSATNTQFVQNLFDAHDVSSLGFNISLNKELGCPLLLGESSWNRSVGISCDYSEEDD